MQLNTGAYEEAIENCRYVLRRDPEMAFCSVTLGRALMLVGKPEEAVPIFQKGPGYQGYLGCAYARLGRRAEAEELAAQNVQTPNRQMFIYACLGDIDRAFEALERFAAQNPPRVLMWLSRPELAPLHQDPRMKGFRQRYGTR
jgi:predicted Zn-dependent protease